ncbi:MAG: nucleotidyltransferase family protein [Leptospiraceae bacterium]|jgi:predicted nucleotidyltransferase|nr:nucleotidyltransferase family protein [Leptospiraceae bacterium]MBL0266646.1 nucleotidyltransferase family protein [Leptospiraceae bacterium]MBP9164086.1 nucleotidyltransferase family protein [Leptospiraceae bacterium]
MILENSAIEIVCNYLAKTETKRASIFGSYARGEAIQSSDLDLLVEFEPSISLLTFVRYKRELENLLGKKVDLLTPASISPYIFPKIQKDLKLIYERK